MRVRALFLALCFLVVACSQEDGATAKSESLTACDGVSGVWESEACREALMLTCREQADQDACWTMPVMEIGVHRVYCAWTNVAVVGEVETCEISSTFGRCEAAMLYWDGPYWGDPCVDGELVREGHIAFAPNMELVDVAPAPYGTLYDIPLGPWSGTGDPDESPVRVCASNGVPPGPEWCACAQAACDAIAEQ